MVIVDALSTAGDPIGIYQTQILPGLSLTAKPSAIVSCLGKSGKTTAAGTLTLEFRKGAARGVHVCSAGRAGYSAGRTTVKVT